MSKKIGLALSGGMVWGAAHIGVLRVLEEYRLKPSAMAGTSAGALIATLYGFGIPLDEIERITRELSWSRISEFSPSQMGLMSNAKIGDIIEKHIGERDLADADIPLAIVALDINNGKKAIYREGNITPIVRGSACIPGIFIPVEYQDHLLVDGGLVEYVPITPLTDKGLDAIIAVDLNAKSRKSVPQDIFEVILNALDIAMDNYHRDWDAADIWITPDLSEYSRFDSEKVPELVNAGYQEAKACLDEAGYS